MMTEILRSRDCIIFYKGDSYPVYVDPAMVQGGWPGGQCVKWVDDPNVDFRTVTYSDGLYGGFLLWGSDESADQFTSITRNQVVYAQATLFSGGSLISTSSYERYTYASRMAGPLVPLVYAPCEPLYFSSRGLWTNEDEMTLAGHPMAPAFFTGFVAQIPKANNNFFLGVQTSL